MYLFTIWLLGATACQQIPANYFSKVNYINCLARPKSAECEHTISLFTEHLKKCVFESNILSAPQGLADFMSGLYNGIQIDAENPSSCVQSFASIQSDYDDVLGGFGIGFTPLVELIYTFNNLVSQLAASYSLCDLNALYNIFFPTKLSLAISSLAGHIIMNESAFNTEIKSFITAWDNEDFISAGISLGKLFTLVTGYSL